MSRAVEVFLDTGLVPEVLANIRHRLVAAFLSTLNQQSNLAVKCDARLVLF